uniref:5'-deoxynucleotidase HDDC2 n=1 Tax=Strongyloides papillosus TaxID=174720 RepID=A0A0N5B8B4_STREA
MVNSNSIDILKLGEVIGNLKHLKRTGWTKWSEIKEVETVACHMYRMAMFSMSIKELRPDLDIDRVIKICLVHDLAEALVGDITPHCGVSDLEKFNLEKEGFQEIINYLPKKTGDEWYEYWMEYEKQETAEARCVKQLDKYDMIAQAYYYEKTYNIDLSDFFNSTEKSFFEVPFIEWNNTLRNDRNEFKSRKCI